MLTNEDVVTNPAGPTSGWSRNVCEKTGRPLGIEEADKTRTALFGARAARDPNPLYRKSLREKTENLADSENLAFQNKMPQSCRTSLGRSGVDPVFKVCVLQFCRLTVGHMGSMSRVWGQWGVTMNKQVRSEREEAEEDCCGVQMDDVRWTFEFKMFIEPFAAAGYNQCEPGVTAVLHHHISKET